MQSGGCQGMFNEHRIFFGVGENVLELGSGDTYTVL
jgi:hypothetical protein